MLRRISAFSLCLWLVMGTLSAYSDEVPRLTFAQLVDSLKANLEVTQKIKSYNGQEVEIQGFIIPAGPPDLSFFLLSRVSAIESMEMLGAMTPQASPPPQGPCPDTSAEKWRSAHRAAFVLTLAIKCSLHHRV